MHIFKEDVVIAQWLVPLIFFTSFFYFSQKIKVQNQKEKKLILTKLDKDNCELKRTENNLPLLSP